MQTSPAWVQFLAVDGRGDPNTAPEYTAAVEALYAVSYTLKFANRKEGGRDFVVAPLEGLWWADHFQAFTAGAKDTWQWTLLISQPDWITGAMITDATQKALAKKKRPGIEKVRQLARQEGRSAQALPIGAYDDTAPAKLTTILRQPVRERHLW